MLNKRKAIKVSNHLADIMLCAQRVEKALNTHEARVVSKQASQMYGIAYQRLAAIARHS